MRLFSRFNKHEDPSDGRIIAPSAMARLPEIGRQAFAPIPEHPVVSDFYLPGLEKIGFATSGPLWDDFIDRFVAELTLGAEQLGDWAPAGAFYVAKDLVTGADWEKPNLIQLMDRSLRFLVGQGVGGGVIPFFAMARYTEIARGAS